MEIKVLEEVKDQPCEVLVINQFEGEKTSQEIANTYAVDKDHFEENLVRLIFCIHLEKSLPIKFLLSGLVKKKNLMQTK